MSTFHTDTVLYHPIEGAKLFPQGEQHPGSAWNVTPVPLVSGRGFDGELLKELASLREQLEMAARRAASKDHDLAQLSAAKSAADGKLADALQRAVTAEQTQAAAEAIASQVTKQRDDLAGQLSAANERAGKLDKANTDLRDLITEYETDVANLKAQIAKFDGDGNGRVGGKRPAAA